MNVRTKKGRGIFWGVVDDDDAVVMVVVVVVVVVPAEKRREEKRVERLPASFGVLIQDRVGFV